MPCGCARDPASDLPLPSYERQFTSTTLVISYVMPPRGANTSASARKRQPGGVVGRNLPSSATNAVSRTAVTTADIARMASSVATTPSPPSLPLLSSSASSDSSSMGKNTRCVSPQRLGKPTAPAAATEQLSQKSSTAIKKTTTQLPQCVWALRLGRPCNPILPAAIPCAVSTCRRLVHHMCIINWEAMHNFEGPVSIVCPEHHAHFNAIGGGRKSGLPSLPTFDVGGGDSFDGNISFSGDGLQLGEEEDAIEDYPDDYDGTDITEYTLDQFEVNKRCSYYMNCVPITHKNRKAVEFVYMIEADTIVRSENQLCKPELAAKLLEKYKHLIAVIPVNCFGDAGLEATMCKGFYRAKKGSAGGLQDKVRKLKSLVQDVFKKCQLPKLPSGCGIFDVHDRYISEKFTESGGGHESEVPDGWWLSNPSCYHLLAAIVHKDNPDIAADPTLLAPGGTRDEQRAQVAKDREKQIIVSKMASVTVEWMNQC